MFYFSGFSLSINLLAICREIRDYKGENNDKNKAIYVSTICIPKYLYVGRKYPFYGFR